MQVNSDHGNFIKRYKRNYHKKRFQFNITQFELIKVYSLLEIVA